MWAGLKLNLTKVLWKKIKNTEVSARQVGKKSLDSLS